MIGPLPASKPQSKKKVEAQTQRDSVLQKMRQPLFLPGEITDKPRPAVTRPFEQAKTLADSISAYNKAIKQPLTFADFMYLNKIEKKWNPKPMY